MFTARYNLLHEALSPAPVAQASKPAVSQVSKPAGATNIRTGCRLGSRRHRRLGCLRYVLEFCILVLSTTTGSPDSYEIQVYGSETVPRGETMVELHSNYTFDGNKNTINGVLPNYHAFHETLEVTRGFTPWFETGFYVFTSIQPGRGWEWVGDHIRPRVRVPDEWHWPVGLSLSTEVGYQRRSFAEDTWTWELRPIIDKQWGPLYVAFNPAFERSLHGLSSSEGFEFAPSAKVSLDLNSKVALGVEYYSSLGRVTHFDDFGDQQHQILPVIDLNVSPKWEINFGVGVGLNHSTDHLMAKFILGRRF